MLCWKCHQEEKEHENSQMDEMMIENENELKIMLNDVMNGINEETNNEQ